MTTYSPPTKRHSSSLKEDLTFSNEFRKGLAELISKDEILNPDLSIRKVVELVDSISEHIDNVNNTILNRTSKHKRDIATVENCITEKFYVNAYNTATKIDSFHKYISFLEIYKCIEHCSDYESNFIKYKIAGELNNIKTPNNSPFIQLPDGQKTDSFVKLEYLVHAYNSALNNISAIFVLNEICSMCRTSIPYETLHKKLLNVLIEEDSTKMLKTHSISILNAFRDDIERYQAIKGGAFLLLTSNLDFKSKKDRLFQLSEVEEIINPQIQSGGGGNKKKKNKK